MALGLLIGRAGAGKTDLCIEQIRQGMEASDTDAFVLLTPEQATFANEKRLLEALGTDGGFRVKVLSFRRLVHWVFQETGGGLMPTLDAVGKSMVLRGILEKRKEELRAFRRVWNKQGFIEQLAEIMEEFRTYRISAEDMAACLDNVSAGDQPPGDLAGRIGDLCLLYADYEAVLAQGWLDLAGELAGLCDTLPKWPRLGNLHFWLDGFHGFTPAEFAVIRTLLAAGRPVRVALNLHDGDVQRAEEDARRHAGDARWLSGDAQRAFEEDAMFFPTLDTASSLLEI